MRILKVWDAEYPWDVRAEKVSSSLTEAGHEVHMVARNRKRQPLTEVLDECTVHRMKPWSWAGRSLDAASQFPAFFSPRWSGLMKRVAREVDAEVILVRDLPLAPTAIKVGRDLGLPAVLDMAENYAAMMRDLWTTGTTRFGDSLVRNPWIVEKVERWVLERIDHTIVVVEESRDRLLADGVPEDRVSIVCNTPSLERLDDFAPIREEAEASRSDDGTLNLVYLGLMEEARGVGLVIEALARARAAGVPARLELIGAGRSMDDFRALVRSLDLSDDDVRFHGFVQYRDALAIVARQDVGLIPHFANEAWETTIPNKLFDYMSLGVPIISSDVTPVKRVLGETGAGLTFTDRDADDLARVIGALHADPSRREMGRRGVRAIRERHHWDRDAVVLERVLADAIASRRPASAATSGRG